MACLTFSVTFLSTLFSACFLENSAYYLLLSPNSIANSGSTTIWIFPLLLLALAPMDQTGPSECPPHTITQGYQDAPCGSLLCLSQGEQLCCKAKAELMINYVHPCLSSLQQETQPWQLRGSCASFWTLEPHISQCLESCTNILALLRCYSKGAEGCCTLLCALAHTLTSLLFAPEK